MSFTSHAVNKYKTKRGCSFEACLCPIVIEASFRKHVSYIIIFFLILIFFLLCMFLLLEFKIFMVPKHFTLNDYM